jgi:hypothetical protein
MECLIWILPCFSSGDTGSSPGDESSLWSHCRILHVDPRPLIFFSRMPNEIMFHFKCPLYTMQHTSKGKIRENIKVDKSSPFLMLKSKWIGWLSLHLSLHHMLCGLLGDYSENLRVIGKFLLDSPPITWLYCHSISAWTGNTTSFCF